MHHLPGLYSQIFADRGVAIETGVRYGPERRRLLDVYRPVADPRAGPPAACWALSQLLADVGTPVRKLEPSGIGHVGLLLAISEPFRWRAPVLPEIVAFISAPAGQ